MCVSVPLCVCVFVCTRASMHVYRYVYATVCVESEDNFQKLVLCFHCRIWGLNSSHPLWATSKSPTGHPAGSCYVILSYIFKKKIIFNSVYMCEVYMKARGTDALKLEIHLVVGHLTWVLGTELRFSGWAASVLNWWAIPLARCISFFFCYWF